MLDGITLQPIGVVHSELRNLASCPLQENEQAPRAIIEVWDQYAAAAGNIRAGQAIILLTWLDKADRSVLLTHPRNDLQAPLTGIFSTRSPDRPNPIGIHFVKVVSVMEGNRFEVAGLEALDQTPVIDIKPDLGR